MVGGEGNEHFSVQWPGPRKAKSLMGGTFNQDVADSSVLVMVSKSSDI